MKWITAALASGGRQWQEEQKENTDNVFVINTENLEEKALDQALFKTLHQLQ